MRKKSNVGWWVLAFVVIIIAYMVIAAGMLINMGANLPTTTPTPTPTATPEPTPSPSLEPEIVWMPEHWVADNVRVTAYCGCSICCGEWASNRPLDSNGNEIVYGATGEVLQSGRSVAVNPRFIPFGSYVYIPNPATGEWDEFVADDKSPNLNHIDVYYSNHQAALASGYSGKYTIYWSNEPLDMELVLGDSDQLAI